jgi:hypothetical protein
MTIDLLIAWAAFVVACLALITARSAVKMNDLLWKWQSDLFKQMMDEAKFSSEQRDKQWQALFQLNAQHEHLVKATKGSMFEMGPPRSAVSRKPN